MPAQITEITMLDITAPEHEVEVIYEHRTSGGVLWVNIDGICRLRVCRIKPRIFKTSIEGKPS